ncbi:hypothetical protein BY996DRAFT_7593214, partial [Phakopsora pachyrhizi]
MVGVELKNTGHFTNEIPTQSLNLNYKSFKQELGKVQERIKKHSFETQRYLKNDFNPIQNLIEKLLRVAEEYKNGEKISFDSKKHLTNISASDMVLNGILDEVRKFLSDLYKIPNIPWNTGMSRKWVIMSGILQVLDPLIKHGFLNKVQMQQWFEDSEVLRNSAYVLSNEFGLHSSYWLPSVEKLINLTADEFLWLSLLNEQEAKNFLRQLIGFTYNSNDSCNISHPKFTPIVNLFIGDSGVTKDTFNALIEAIDSSEKFSESTEQEIELISKFMNQALTYVQSYAPDEVKSYYAENRFNIFWKKKELLDNFCQLIPISKQYKRTAINFVKRKRERYTEGLDQIESDDEYDIYDFKKVLKALRKEEGLINNGNEDLNKKLLRKYPTVKKSELLEIVEFRAKIKQISDSLSLIPHEMSEDIYDWLQLPKQEKLLDMIKNRALLLEKEIKTLFNLINQLRGN